MGSEEASSGGAWLEGDGDGETAPEAAPGLVAAVASAATSSVIGEASEASGGVPTGGSTGAEKSESLPALPPALQAPFPGEGKAYVELTVAAVSAATPAPEGGSRETADWKLCGGSTDGSTVSEAGELGRVGAGDRMMSR